MHTNLIKRCLCDSGKRFTDCCEPLLLGRRTAKTPVQLMRSRYCAYAIGGHGDYLLSTWLPSSAIGLNAAELGLRSVDWVALTVMNKSQRGNLGFVEFKAAFLDKSGARQLHHEKSVFERLDGHWYYVGEQADTNGN